MQHSWTGGQYSLFRILFGVGLLSWFLELALRPDSSLRVSVAERVLEPMSPVAPSVLIPLLGISFSVLLLLGKWDKLAAWFLFFLFPYDQPVGGLLVMIHPVNFLLLAHLFTQKAPYGSLAALGRPDPDGEWRLYGWLYALAWVYLVSVMLGTCARVWSEGMPWEQNGEATLVMLGQLAAAFLPLVALLLFWRLPSKAPAWLLFSAVGALLVSFGDQGGWAWWLLMLFCFNPGWFPANHEKEPVYIFYDGYCGLCHRFCRLILAEDTDGKCFKLAPLQGDRFASWVSEAERADLPDSVILRTTDGTLQARSDAALAVFHGLGGFWRVVAVVGRLVPPFLRNGAYDLLAAIRHRLFKRPADACPLIPPRLRGRFDY